MTEEKKRSKLVELYFYLVDLLENGKEEDLIKNIFKFEQFYLTTNRYLEKFMRGDDNKLELGAGDILNLCNACQPVLIKYEKRINHVDVHKEIWSLDDINRDTIRPWFKKLTDGFLVVSRLRSFLSVMTYTYCMLDLCETELKQTTDIQEVLRLAIKECLRDGY